MLKQQPKPHVLGPQRRTSFLVWCLAFICAIIAFIIIIAGIVVFIGYLAIRPKVPILYVHQARLDDVAYDQEGVLSLRLIILVKAENHNMKTHATFYNTKLTLGYHGLSIAQLVAYPFDVMKNSSIELHYLVESSRIPLDPHEQDMTEVSLQKTKVMPFFVKGSSRTRFRVGRLGSVKFWLHLHCYMWLPVNNTPVYPHCRRSSH